MNIASAHPGQAVPDHPGHQNVTLNPLFSRLTNCRTAPFTAIDTDCAVPPICRVARAGGCLGAAGATPLNILPDLSNQNL